MRSIALIALVCSILTLRSQIVQDNGNPPAKQHPPELEALSAIGTWNGEFTMRETPDSKEVKGKVTFVNRWSPSGQFLISDAWLMLPRPGMPNGWLNGLEITTWDPVKKEYHVVRVMSYATTTSLVTVEGKRSWKIAEENTTEGVNYCTTTSERVSDSQISLRTVCSRNGGAEWVFAEAVANKTAD